jgi:hypothetical protein
MSRSTLANIIVGIHLLLEVYLLRLGRILTGHHFSLELGDLIIEDYYRRGKFKGFGTDLHRRANPLKGSEVLLEEIRNAKVGASLFFPKANFQRENSWTCHVS